jgi:hypothetical protein
VPPLLRTCSEPGCTNKLVNEDGTPKPSGTKTCGQKCRQKRARRLKNAQKRGGSQSKHAVEVQDMAAATRGEVTDAIHEVAVEEIRPLVREAMTEEVLSSISTMVGLTPKAIAVLQEQMDSADETIAQRAATLFLKYTMGNPSVAPPPSEKAPPPMSVVFNIPRPGDPTDTTLVKNETAYDGDMVELRQCSDCSQHKSDDEFVGASSRCQECFDRLHEELGKRFAVDDESKPDA